MTNSSGSGSEKSNEGVEVRARTVDEAVARGLVRLGGLSRAEVEIEIVKEGRSGLLGFGAEEALVRITPRAGGAAKPAEPAARKAEQRAASPKEGGARATEGDSGRADRTAEAPAGGRGRGRGRGRGQQAPERAAAPAARGEERQAARPAAAPEPPREATERRPAKAEAPPTAADGAADEAAGKRRRRRRRRPDGAGAPADEGTSASTATSTGHGDRPAQAPRVTGRREPAASSPRERAALRPAPDADGDPAAISVEVVTTLLGLLGYPDASIAQSESLLPMELDEDGEDALVLGVEGDRTEVLLANDAEALNALQFLARLVVNRRLGRWISLVIDVGGDRQRRIKELMSLAHQSADLVESGGRPVSLPPMSAYERRVVHLVLKERPAVATQSIGAGDRRKVTVRRVDQLLPELD